MEILSYPQFPQWLLLRLKIYLSIHPRPTAWVNLWKTCPVSRWIELLQREFTRDGALVSHTWHDRWSLTRTNSLVSKLFLTKQHNHKHKGDVIREVPS
jgi:hypothetical protein